MSGLKMRIVAAAALCAALSVTGCADGGNALTSPIGPSPVVSTPTVPASCTVPSTPADLSARVNSTDVELTWSPVAQAGDYVIGIGTTPMATDVVFTNTTEPHHALTNLAAGTLYAHVRAHNWCGGSEPSEPVEFTVK